MHVRLIFFITLVCALPASAATQLVLWTFGPNSAGFTTAATSGVNSGSAILTLADGDLDANGKDGTAYMDIVGTNHDPGQSAAWNDIKVQGPDAEVLIEFSTLGYKDVSVRFDYRSEGAVSFDLAYSLNNVDFTQVADNESINVNWDNDIFETVSLDFSSTSALNNQGTLYFRIDDLEEGTGNDRFAFDNFEISANPIPEPSTGVLLGSAFLIALRRRRRSLA